jgi:hypothetical protein
MLELRRRGFNLLAYNKRHWRRAPDGRANRANFFRFGLNLRAATGDLI